MYERFTDRARRVMQLANQEAQRFNHEYIGTEHILLGLVKEGSGVAATVLDNLDITLRRIRLEVERLMQHGQGAEVVMGRQPLTPRAKKVIEYSIAEADNLNRNYVGTEHLLLGLLCEQEGAASQVLVSLGVTPEVVREAVMHLLIGGKTGGQLNRDAYFAKTGLKANPVVLNDADVKSARKLLEQMETTDKQAGEALTPEDIRALKRLLADDGEGPCCGEADGCPAGDCQSDEVVTGYMSRHIEELKAELKFEKDLNRKLWVVIAEMRQATGIAFGSMSVNSPEWNAFSGKCKHVTTLLNDIIPLAPAGGSNAA